MKDDSGHMNQGGPISSGQPFTKSAGETFTPATNHGYLGPSMELSLEAQPTAWKSAPAAVRFAVWVWAISVIVGLAAAIVGVLAWVLIFGAALSQL